MKKMAKTFFSAIVAVFSILSLAVAQPPEGAEIAPTFSAVVSPFATVKVPVEKVAILRPLSEFEKNSISYYLDECKWLKGENLAATRAALEFLTEINQSHFPLTRTPAEYMADYQIFTQLYGQTDWYVKAPAEREWPVYLPEPPTPICFDELSPTEICPAPLPETIRIGEKSQIAVNFFTEVKLEKIQFPCTNELVGVKPRELGQTTINRASPAASLPVAVPCSKQFSSPLFPAISGTTFSNFEKFCISNLPEISVEIPEPVCQPVVTEVAQAPAPVAIPIATGGMRPLGSLNISNPEANTIKGDLLLYYFYARAAATRVNVKQSQSQSQNQNCGEEANPGGTCPPGEPPTPPPPTATDPPDTDPPLGSGGGWDGPNQPPDQPTPPGVDRQPWEPPPPTAQ